MPPSRSNSQQKKKNQSLNEEERRTDREGPRLPNILWNQTGTKILRDQYPKMKHLYRQTRGKCRGGTPQTLFGSDSFQDTLTRAQTYKNRDQSRRRRGRVVREGIQGQPADPRSEQILLLLAERGKASSGESQRGLLMKGKKWIYVLYTKKHAGFTYITLKFI